ncbi:MAG: hypothetical protein Q9192_005221, partial [Flavoplaca navasiana]
MVPRQRLQQYHPESHALDAVQYRHPTPQRAAKDSSESRRVEGNVGTDAADAPEHLRPPRSTQTRGEDGEDPRVLLAQMAEDEQHQGPNADEEDEEEQHDRPG